MKHIAIYTRISAALDLGRTRVIGAFRLSATTNTTAARARAWWSEPALAEPDTFVADGTRVSGAPRQSAAIKLFAITILISLLISSCVEEYKVEVDKSSSTVLVVDGLLTTDTVAHRVKLSTSVPYGKLSEGAPAVSGAKVTLDDGSGPVLLTEDGNTGCYYTPEDYFGVAGKSYKLSIDAEVNGETGHYEAVETMPEKGIRADAFDYYKLMDSVWVFAIWGQDLPGIISHYGGELVVHGERKPYTSWVFIDGSDMFDGNYLECGEYLFYTCSAIAENTAIGSPAPTPLVKGDVVTLYFYSMADFFYNWFMSMATESMVHIPMFSPQPANIESNISGGAYGVFGLANLTKISVTIDDPDRNRFQMILDHRKRQAN